MKRLFVFVLFTIISSLFLSAQENAEETYKEMFLDGEFFFYEEEYIDALTFYNQLYKRGYKDNANINYRIGICYLNIPGKKDQSISYLEKAKEKADDSYKEGVFKQDKAPMDVYIYLGNAYRVNNRLEDAIDTYRKYKTLVGDKKEAEKRYADQQIAACKVAQKKIKSPFDVKFENIGEIINSASSNYNPVVSGDQKSMVYMNELPFYDALYYSTKDVNGNWQKPRNITPEVQSDGDMLSLFLSDDGKILLLSREDPFNSDIWMSKLTEEGKWEKAIPFDKTINSKYWESNASLSPDNKKLFFASNRNNGFGLMDIYVSELNEENYWTTPVNLGNTINTDLNEDCPVMSSDGKTLYFSSQGHDCMGGYDIFYSSLNEDGTWSEPVNMGYPLNTTDDEVFFYPGKEKGEGYFARLAEDSYGKEDIYAVKVEGKLAVAEPEVVEEKTPEPVETITPVPPPVPEPEVETITVESQPVLFDFNKININAEAAKVLNKLVNIMKENPESMVELTGYTDAIGSVEINNIIAQQRAQSARMYLMQSKIANNRIKVFSYGKSRYVALNNNPDGTDNSEGRKYNRRVEVKLTHLNENVNIKELDLIPDNLKIEK